MYWLLPPARCFWQMNGYLTVFNWMNPSGLPVLLKQRTLPGLFYYGNKETSKVLAVERIRDMGGAPGTATIANWTLRVHGEVEKPIVLSYQDLLNLDQVQITCDIHCVTGWTLLDSRWSGVRLTTIMDRVRPHRSAGFVIFEAAGDYTSNIPMSEARKGDVILAHSFFGEKLQQAHGAPVRALVPDCYFYKSAKWMEAVKITSRDEPGFWERQGYSNSADPWKEERYEQGR